MGLNKSKGNMYEFVTHTWNTIKGLCPHGCTYCYMKNWGKQRPVRFDEDELRTNLGSGNFIFVGSSCDVFANKIPERWIIDTMSHCRKFVNNRYLFQSKNPIRMLGQVTTQPSKTVVCTTIETNRWMPEIMKDSPTPEHRAYAMSGFSIDRFVTIEPVIDFDLDELVRLVKVVNPKQVNIGADSGRNGLPEPSADKVLALIDALKEFTTISQKRNLKRLLAAPEAAND
jgi:DNA repair photolyase